MRSGTQSIFVSLLKGLLVGLFVTVAVSWFCAWKVPLDRGGYDVHRFCTDQNEEMWFVSGYRRPGAVRFYWRHESIAQSPREWLNGVSVYSTKTGSTRYSYSPFDRKTLALFDSLRPAVPPTDGSRRGIIDCRGFPFPSLAAHVGGWNDGQPVPVQMSPLGLAQNGVPLILTRPGSTGRPETLVVRGGIAAFPSGTFIQPEDFLALPFLPIWWAMAANILFYAGLSFLVQYLFLSTRSRFRRRRGGCASCGYQLDASQPRCPECGIEPRS